MFMSKSYAKRCRSGIRWMDVWQKKWDKCVLMSVDNTKKKKYIYAHTIKMYTRYFVAWSLCHERYDFSHQIIVWVKVFFFSFFMNDKKKKKKKKIWLRTNLKVSSFSKSFTSNGSIMNVCARARIQAFLDVLTFRKVFFSSLSNNGF